MLFQHRKYKKIWEEISPSQTIRIGKGTLVQMAMAVKFMLLHDKTLHRMNF